MYKKYNIILFQYNIKLCKLNNLKIIKIYSIWFFIAFALSYNVEVFMLSKENCCFYFWGLNFGDFG